ncbi:hypothetical protein D3C87_1248900 [compost metagenome]
MGDYVACLLETGELPSLGGEDTTAADEGCNSSFAKATWTGGRPSTGNGGSGSGNTNTTTNNSSSDSDTGGSSSGSSNNRYAGSNSRNGGRFFTNQNNRGGGLDGENAGTGKTVEIALDGGGSGSFFNSNQASAAIRQQRKVSYVPILGLTEAEKKKLEKKEESKQTLIAGDGFATAPKKTAVKKPEPKAELEAEEKPFTIGNFIRILFIAAIIIAIVIFIGGQALQMSKSMEK